MAGEWFGLLPRAGEMGYKISGFFRLGYRHMFSFRFRRLAATAISGLAVIATPAAAQSLDDMQRQLESLQAQVTELQAQIEAAKQAAAEAKAAAEARPATVAEAQPDEKNDLKVTWKGAPELSSADGAYRMKLRGRVVVDAGFGDQDETVTGNGTLKATEFRAVRLGVEGVLARDFSYLVETELAGETPQLILANIGYKGLPADITLGLMKTGNSLEESTSFRFITFMERAAITDSFGFATHIGVTVGKKAGAWTLQGGIFRGSNSTADTDEGLVLSARGTVSPRIGDMAVLHLGAHVRYREVGAGQALLGYSQRPHQHLAGKTLDLPGFAKSDTLIGGEAALLAGPFSLQGEYMRLHAENDDPAGPNPNFDGYYVDATWFLTGENRNYSGGVFNRVSVRRPVTQGGAGAWELAARFDTVNLSDGAFDGGSQDSYIFGVNWYLNDYVRMTANYNKSKVYGGANDGADIDLFGLRAQLDW